MEMFGLKEKECADLLEIVRRIIGDETEFEHMVAKTVNLSHNLSDKDISQQDVLDTCSEITKMICDYGLLLHILVELRKKGKINFNEGKQKEDLLNLIILIKKIQEKLLIVKQYLRSEVVRENSGLRDFLWGILVFDRDYLVAEAGLEDYRPGERMVVVYTQTYFSSRGYMQRAVEIV